MTIELIIALVGCVFGVIGTLFGVFSTLTSARKDRVETILAVLNEIEDQYAKLKARYEQLEKDYQALQAERRYL